VSRLLRVSPLIMILALGASAAFADSSLPYRDLGGLYDAQRQIQFTVSDYRDARGKAWIRVVGECEGVYRQKAEDVLATLWDFRSWPKTFPRIEAVKLRSDDGTTAVIEQRTEVRILSFAYVSDLVFREVLSRSGKSAVVSFDKIQADEAMLSSKGSWTLEDRSDASGDLTYVRYYSESYMAPQYPAQAAIMRQLGPADLCALVRQLGEATSRRVRKG
jgi:hypothetical protein